MKNYKIPIERHQASFVVVAVNSAAAITDELIHDAISKTLTHDEWDEVNTTIGKPSPLSEAEAGEYYVYEPKPEISLAARAREIGVSVVTLRKWRDEKSVDVFNDELVKRHVSLQRNHNWKIAARFKPSLQKETE